MFFSTRWKNQEKINTQVNLRVAAIDTALHDSFNKVKSDVLHINQWIKYLHDKHDQNQDKITHMESRMSSFLTREELRHFVDEYYEGLDTVAQALSETKNEVSNKVSALSHQVAEQNRNSARQIEIIYANQQNVFARLEQLSVSYRQATNSLQNELKNNIQNEVNSQLSEKISSEVQTRTSTLFERLERLNQKVDELSTQKPLVEQQTQQQLVQQPVPQEQSIQPQNRRAALREKIFRKVTRHSKEYVKGMLMSLIKKYTRISGLNLREIVVEEQGIVSKSSFYRLLTEIESDEHISVVQEGKEKHYMWGPSALARQ